MTPRRGGHFGGTQATVLALIALLKVGGERLTW